MVELLDDDDIALLRSKSMEDYASQRPRKPVTEKDLFALRQMHANMDEAASFFGCATRTLYKEIAKDPRLTAAWEMGKGAGKIGLRRLQWRSANAVDAKQNPTGPAVQMQLHLSKHWLNEHDRHLNMNVTADDLDKAIAELERDVGGVISATTNARNAREAQAPEGSAGPAAADGSGRLPN